MLSENATTDDRWPSVAQISDKKIWVVWSSDRDDDWEIYYKTSSEISPVHNVAIADVSSPSVEVYQSENVTVSVVTENRGDFNESVTVKCYVNSSLLGVQTTTLSAGDSVTMFFHFDTSGFSPGLYVLKATVDVVPGENTINTGDNTFTDGTIIVKIIGDVNGDMVVDVLDLEELAESYGTTSDRIGWDPEADINRDNMVDVRDLALLGKNYMKSSG